MSEDLLWRTPGLTNIRMFTLVCVHVKQHELKLLMDKRIASGIYNYVCIWCFDR